MSDNLNEENKEVEVTFDEEGSEMESLLTQLIRSYQEAANKYSTGEKEIKYELTLTIHKVARPEGNRDVAYLRLNKTSKVGEETSSSLILQQMHVFSSLKERLNPNNPWKDNLYLNALAYLVGGGLEYADFLRKSKQIATNMAAAKKAEEEAKTPITTATDVDHEYLAWLAKEREKEFKEGNDVHSKD